MFIDRLLYLPDLTEVGFWWKTMVLALIALATGWVLTILLLKTAYRKSDYRSRDLVILLSRFWSSIIVLILIQLYGVLVLNWFLGSSERERLQTLSLYLRFGPEWIVSATVGGIVVFLRRQILDSTRPARLNAAANPTSKP